MSARQALRAFAAAANAKPGSDAGAAAAAGAHPSNNAPAANPSRQQSISTTDALEHALRRLAQAKGLAYESVLLALLQAPPATRRTARDSRPPAAVQSGHCMQETRSRSFKLLATDLPRAAPRAPNRNARSSSLAWPILTAILWWLPAR